jgi:pSer/pThr/pTyr-binding forkhead associated (FHA) protein
MLKLSVLAGPDVGSVFSPVSARIVIGREDDCDVVLRHPSIAPRHCSIQRKPGNTFILSDLHTPTGTFLSDGHTSVDTYELHSGDEILVGDNRIRIELPEEERSEKSPSVSSSHVQVEQPTVATTRTAAENGDLREGRMTRLKKLLTALIPPIGRRT